MSKTEHQDDQKFDLELLAQALSHAIGEPVVSWDKEPDGTYADGRRRRTWYLSGGVTWDVWKDPHE